MRRSSGKKEGRSLIWNVLAPDDQMNVGSTFYFTDTMATGTMLFGSRMRNSLGQMGFCDWLKRIFPYNHVSPKWLLLHRRDAAGPEWGVKLMVAIVATLMEHRRDTSCLMMESMHVHIYHLISFIVAVHNTVKDTCSVLIKTQFQILVVCVDKCFREMIEEMHIQPAWL